MNKRIDLTKLGGYPLAQEDLDWLQISYRSALAAMANFIGDKVIISGMVEAGGDVTAGWISIGGELVPFEAGTIGGGEFIIDELITPLVFEDGNSKDVLYERIAKFSVGGGYQYSDLKRAATLKLNLPEPGDVKMVSCDGAYLIANFEGNGLGKNKREGWALCNGNNGTPNLSGKFIVGYDPADPDYDAIGDNGGAKGVTLTDAQTAVGIKPHVGAGGLIEGYGAANAPSNDNYDPTRAFVPITEHENRPPYYTLAYIIKL